GRATDAVVSPPPQALIASAVSGTAAPAVRRPILRLRIMAAPLSWGRTTWTVGRAGGWAARRRSGGPPAECGDAGVAAGTGCVVSPWPDRTTELRDTQSDAALTRSRAAIGAANGHRRPIATWRITPAPMAFRAAYAVHSSGSARVQW